MSILINWIECVRRPNPPNGRIQCDSKRYAAGKSCYLECDTGYMPLGKTFMTCEQNSDTGYWICKIAFLISKLYLRKRILKKVFCSGSKI